MKLIWLGYLVYSLGNCTIKLCIETGLRGSSEKQERSGGQAECARARAVWRI